MAFLPPHNDIMLAKLTGFEQQRYVNMAKGMAEVAKENPNMDTLVYTRYLDDFLKAGIEHRAVLDADIAKATAASITQDPREAHSKSVKMRTDFTEKFLKETLPTFGPQGAEAWEKLGKRMRPKSIPELAMNQFYDGDKGGVKWAGLVGGLAGGFFIFNALGGGMMGIAAALLAAVAGAWLANGAAKSIGSFLDKKADHAAANSPHASIAKVRQHELAHAPDVDKFQKPDLGTLVANIKKPTEGMVYTQADSHNGPGATPARKLNQTTRS